VDRWCQVKVALDTSRRRVEKVFALVEGAFTRDEEIEVESTTFEVEEEEREKKGEGKRKGKRTEMRRKREKEEKVDFSYVLKGSGSWFGESSKGKKSKAELDWAVGLGKLKEVDVGDIGYCNSCLRIGGGIGSFCKNCKSKLVLV